MARHSAQSSLPTRSAPRMAQHSAQRRLPMAVPRQPVTRSTGSTVREQPTQPPNYSPRPAAHQGQARVGSEDAWLLPMRFSPHPEGSDSPLAQRDGLGDRVGTPRLWSSPSSCAPLPSAEYARSTERG